ncbi:MAG TPA: DUF4139 domain-containing protein, partial [Polyangiaceae bacterium]|nr:DUF4139 domain-containing protein [Polyangiaceae bacterium]
MRRSFVHPLLIAALVSSVAAGCASAQLPPPIQTEAALGRVVVYRNGVAYFERRATVRGNELTLDVPGQRLDDFLKSLTVVDVRTGRPVPISFPTLEDNEQEVTIVLELPKNRVHELKISYVTESPSWKPSYRLELHGTKPARLEAWAVVHNVSGEDWKNVAVGVGSTSALSFKYDLKSVHYVDRETLTDGVRLGIAPPTGGSPYEVAKNEVQVLGAVRRETQASRVTVAGSAESRSAKDHRAQAAPAAAMDAATGAGSGMGRGDGLAQVAQRAKKTQQKIRVEGFAKPDDKDRFGASLANANSVRDGLVQNGVPAEQIEVVATGQASAGEQARVVAVDPQIPRPAQPGAANDEPLGDAYFLAPSALDVRKNHSAMVNVLTAEAHAEPVYFYDPISARGSTRFAFRAVLLENPSVHTLDPGPVTVYSEGQFLGEGLADAIPPKSRAFVPFSLDRKLVVEGKESGRDEIDRLVTVQRGVLTTEARRVRRTELTLVNRGTSEAIVYVRHAVPEGYRLEKPATGYERLREAYLFPVKVAAGASAVLAIEEATPMQKSVDIGTAAGIGDLKLYLRSATKLDPETRQRL